MGRDHLRPGVVASAVVFTLFVPGCSSSTRPPETTPLAGRRAGLGPANRRGGVTGLVSQKSGGSPAGGAVEVGRDEAVSLRLLEGFKVSAPDGATRTGHTAARESGSNPPRAVPDRESSPQTQAGTPDMPRQDQRSDGLSSTGFPWKNEHRLP